MAFDTFKGLLPRILPLVLYPAGHALRRRMKPAPRSPGAPWSPHGVLRGALYLVLGSSVLSLLLLSSQTTFAPFAASSTGLRRPDDAQQEHHHHLNTSGDNLFGQAHLQPLGGGKAPTFLLLRAVGNALPPRHDPSQTLVNLRFILEHEHLDGEAEGEIAKHWVLNRIVDPAVRAQVKALFREFGASFSEIPFQLDDYARQPFKVVVEDRGVDDVHAPHPDEEEADGEWQRVVRYNELYDNKIRHAISINYARNVMLDLGRQSGARWILPWDQNCFLTNDAWRQIKGAITTQEAIGARMAANAFAMAAAGNGQHQPPPVVKYLVSYMDRLTRDNDEILSPEFHADPWEEPQIIFRNDAVERFDEQLRYGKRDKAALLIRLKVPGAWDDWGWSNWEQQQTYRNISRDVDGVTVPSAGYVVRLFSGKGGSFESNDAAAGLWREIKRGEGVLNFMNALEVRVMRETFKYRSEDLVVYDCARLGACHGAFKGKNDSDTASNTCADSLLQVFAVLADAEKALRVAKPFTITDNSALDPFRHTHFFSNYYDQAAGVAQDSEDDGLVLRHMVYNTTSLVLAWVLTADDKYAAKAVEFLDAMFVNASTYMDTTLDYTDLSFLKQITSPAGYALGEPSGIRHTAALPQLLDAIRLLKSSSTSHLYSQEWMEKLDKWIADLYDVLRKKLHAQTAFRYAPGLFGLQYDLQVATLAAYMDDPLTLRYTLGTVHGRFLTMISRVEELLVPLGVSTTHYTLLTLSTVGQLADLASRFNMTSHMFLADVTFGRNVETVNTKNGGLLCRFVERHLPCCHQSSGRSRNPSGALDSVGTCVSALQSADDGELFIYSRLAKHAVKHCPELSDRLACSSLSAMAQTEAALPAKEANRFQLPPYPFLQRHNV